MRYFILLSFLLILTGCQRSPSTDGSRTSKASPASSSTPSPTPFQSYQAPAIEAEEVYVVALLGDSMTAALGPHGGPFTEELNRLYQDRDILVDNYAQGSTNLLSLEERLTQSTQFNEWTFDPLLERNDLDLIIVESFAYNPLSQIQDQNEALARQEEVLTDLMQQLTTALPNTRIVFVATIAPSRDNYAQAAVGLTDEESRLQAQERIAYLENHIEFARTHQIPLINMYQASLTEQGVAKTEYINHDDWIHPSAQGITFISTQMANFIFNQEILPR